MIVAISDLSGRYSIHWSGLSEYWVLGYFSPPSPPLKATCQLEQCSQTFDKFVCAFCLSSGTFFIELINNPLKYRAAPRPGISWITSSGVWMTNWSSWSKSILWSCAFLFWIELWTIETPRKSFRLGCVECRMLFKDFVNVPQCSTTSDQNKSTQVSPDIVFIYCHSVDRKPYFAVTL